MGQKLGQTGPKWAQNEVFGHFLNKKSLDFADFAYYDRQAWYLATDSGQCAEKKYLGLNLGHLGPIWAQNEVFGHLLDFGSFDLPDFAYYVSPQ